MLAIINAAHIRLNPTTNHRPLHTKSEDLSHLNALTPTMLHHLDLLVGVITLILLTNP